MYIPIEWTTILENEATLSHGQWIILQSTYNICTAVVCLVTVFRWCVGLHELLQVLCRSRHEAGLRLGSCLLLAFGGKILVLPLIILVWTVSIGCANLVASNFCNYVLTISSVVAISFQLPAAWQTVLRSIEPGANSSASCVRMNGSNPIFLVMMIVEHESPKHIMQALNALASSEAHGGNIEVFLSFNGDMDDDLYLTTLRLLGPEKAHFEDLPAKRLNYCDMPITISKFELGSRRACQHATLTMMEQRMALEHRGVSRKSPFILSLSPNMTIRADCLRELAAAISEDPPAKSTMYAATAVLGEHENETDFTTHLRRASSVHAVIHAPHVPMRCSKHHLDHSCILFYEHLDDGSISKEPQSDATSNTYDFHALCTRESVPIKVCTSAIVFGPVALSRGESDGDCIHSKPSSWLTMISRGQMPLWHDHFFTAAYQSISTSGILLLMLIFISERETVKPVMAMIVLSLMMQIAEWLLLVRLACKIGILQRLPIWFLPLVLIMCLGRSDMLTVDNAQRGQARREALKLGDTITDHDKAEVIRAKAAFQTTDQAILRRQDSHMEPDHHISMARLLARRAIFPHKILKLNLKRGARG